MKEEIIKKIEEEIDEINGSDKSAHALNSNDAHYLLGKIEGLQRAIEIIKESEQG